MRIRGLAGVVAVLALAGCTGSGGQDVATVTETVTATVTAEPTQTAQAEDDDESGEVAVMVAQFSQHPVADQESLCRLWEADMDAAYDRLVESGTDVSVDAFELFVTRVC